MGNKKTNMLNTKKKNLAINGGKPVRKKPWLDNFTVGNEEKKSISKVIDSGYLSLFEGSHTPDYPFSFDREYIKSLKKHGLVIIKLNIRFL